MWSCTSCGKVFKNYMLVTLHRRTHWEFRPFKCTFRCCTKAFCKLSELQSHARFHKEHRIYQCKACHQQFFTLRHRKLHRCCGNRLRLHRCHICAASFMQIVSLSNHIHKKHLWLFKGKHKISTKQKLQFGDDRGSVKSSNSGSGSDDSKILLKITAGKSMTIVSSPSKLSIHNSRNKCWKKKSKKKYKNKSKKVKNNGLILSIKRDVISINDEKQNINNNSLQKCNGHLTSNCMLAEKKNDLKWTIKSCPEISHTSQRIDSKLYDCDNDSDDMLISNKPFRNNSLNNISGSEGQGDAMESEGISNQLVTTMKERNGIVISKDKLGKFLSEQLQVAKTRRKDRKNVFDNFKDVEIWKVMPSPQTERPEDLLKIKLSPHKPVIKTDHINGDANPYERVKYLGIPSKVKNGIFGKDSDILDLLHVDVDEKESDVGINSLNDSGLEMLSRSSCNKSNGNSVRSAVFDENSPTYLNTEHSLLSPDSPFMEGLIKTEHSICNRCDGITLEHNNNTHSPGKCQCNLSVPNSPFHHPVSPLKTFSNLSEISKTQEVKTMESLVILGDKEHITNAILNPSIGSKTEVISDNENNLPYNVAQIDPNHVCDSDDSDIVIISVGKKKSLKYYEKMKCRLKLKKNGSKTSAGKAFNTECNNCSLLEHVQTSNDNIIEKDSLEEMSCTSSNICQPNVCMNSFNSLITVIGNEDDGENVEIKYQSSSEPVNEKDVTSKLSRKRPLFKSEKPDCHSAIFNDKLVNQEFTKCGIVNKKPLLKKQPSFDDITYGDSKLPLFERQKSAPGCCDSDLITAEGKNKKCDDILENLNMVSLGNENAKHSKSTENVLFEGDLISFQQDKVCEPGKQVDTSKYISNDFVNIVNDNKQKKDSCEGTFENCEKVTNVNTEGKAVLCSVHDNSQQQLPEIMSNDTNAVSNKTKLVSNPLDLYQQQFLSFISGNGKLKENNLAQSKMEAVKKGSRSNGNIDDNLGDLTKSKLSENVEVTKLTSPERNDEPSDSYSWLRIFSHKSKGDLASIEKETEKSKDEFIDIKKDLAAIDMKMVKSEGEDTNSLDIDLFKLDKCPSIKPNSDMSIGDHSKSPKIQSEINLSSESCAEAPPRRRQVAKRTGMKCSSKKKTLCENVHKHSDSASSADAVDLVSHCVDAHGLDISPSNDSYDDFVPEYHKTHLLQTCSEVKRKSSGISLGSGDDIRSDSDMDEKCDSQAAASSRKKRTEKSRKRCSCCIGSQKLNTKEDNIEHHQEQNYRLPRQHKQFVRSTLKLLALQEKLHILFLNLFPECIDRLNKSKVGTDEFEALIEDILYGLEEQSTELPQVFTSINVTVQDPLVKSHFSSCPVDISMSLPDVTQTNGIDFVSLNDKSLTTPYKESSLLNTSLMYQSESSFKDLSFVPASIFNHTETCLTEHINIQNSGSHVSELVLSSAKSDPICLAESSTNLIFENNTLTSSPDRKFCTDRKRSSVSKYNLDQHEFDIAEFVGPETASNDYMIPSVVTQGHSATVGLDIFPSAKHDGSITLASSICMSPSTQNSSILSAPYSDTKTFSQTMDSVQSELIITIDLSAAKVSLCRNPKDCLKWLQNKIMRLTQCLLPRIVLKKYIYKNIDNLEFMLDLLIEANSSGSQIPNEEEDFEAGFSYDVWNVPHYGILQTVLVPTVINMEDMNLSTVLPETENSLERGMLFVNCFDLNEFEQEIKLQRESLKKDLFQIDEENPELMFSNSDDILSNSEHVLHSIQSLSKIASRNRKARSRDSRCRKRSADDKRTLFVQEKLNSQSSIILHSPSKSNKRVQKSACKRSLSGDSQATFLSQFSLGDRNEITTASKVFSKKMCPDSVNNHNSSKSHKNVKSVVGKKRMKNIRVKAVTEAEANLADAEIENGIEHNESIAKNTDTESGNHLKLTGKNIFELMQPC